MLELLKRTRNEEVVENTAEPVNLMHQYFSQFGEKDCVVGDLRLYLDLLTPAGRLQLLQKVRNKVAETITNEMKKKKKATCQLV